ncbi:family 43 glycosylhydrolase, partial [Sinomonas humi]|uniref:family 43 glycosylhydrolase n=1 Tax=Sinomonas humi TaxID=1338436 RepID=UPI0012E0BE7F
MTEPAISGFHPDPSICRADGAYYIASSSFEYSPGVPIHRSPDLLNWTLIGNALDRPSQLRPSAGAPSSGIYAPT